MQAFKINDNNKIPAPKSISYGLVPFFGASTMTTQNGRTITGATRWKRKLIVTWEDIKASDATELFNSIYGYKDIYINYYDVLLGKTTRKIFVNETESAMPIKYWRNGKNYYANVTFEFVERGCSHDINNIQ